MQICADHWARLRTKVNDAGLGPLVAEGGEEALKKLVREVGGEDSVDTYEPLMGAHYAIMGFMLDVGGLAVLTNEGCPLCYGNEQHDLYCPLPDAECPKDGKHFDWTLDRAVSDQVTRWKELNA